MHELLAQLYGTKEKIASQAAQVAPVVAAPAAVQEETFSPEEAQFNEFIVDEIVKVANAEGIDLRKVSDEDLVSLMNEYKAEYLSEQEKVASAGAPEVAAAEDPLVQADLVGRTIAHALYDESNKIQDEIAAHEKLAGLSDEEIFDALASQRAENILQALVGNGEGFMKEASAQVEDTELDDLVTERAAEMLDAAGFDVDAIAAALAGE